MENFLQFFIIDWTFQWNSQKTAISKQHIFRLDYTVSPMMDQIKHILLCVPSQEHNVWHIIKGLK